MLVVLILSTLYTYTLSQTVNPTTTDPYATAELIFSPSRGRNVITGNNQWSLYQSASDFLNDWGLSLRLSAGKYGFKSGAKSTLAILMDGSCDSNFTECDAYFAFGIGNQQYVTFTTDLDGGMNIAWPGASRIGSFAYPQCGMAVASGDASQIMKSITNVQGVAHAQRDAVCGGDDTSCELLRATPNGPNWPLTFVFINDDIAGTFTFRFTSPTFGSDPLECVWENVETCQNFTLYVSPDAGREERLLIDYFSVFGSNIGCDTSNPTPEPTMQPTIEPTEDCCYVFDDIGTYLDKCYCSNNTAPTPQPTIRTGGEVPIGIDSAMVDPVNRHGQSDGKLFVLMSMALNIMMFCYIVMIHSGFCDKRRGGSRHQKVCADSDTEHVDAL